MVIGGFSAILVVSGGVIYEFLLSSEGCCEDRRRTGDDIFRINSL